MIYQWLGYMDSYMEKLVVKLHIILKEFLNRGFFCIVCALEVRLHDEVPDSTVKIAFDYILQLGYGCCDSNSSPKLKENCPILEQNYD